MRTICPSTRHVKKIEQGSLGMEGGGDAVAPRYSDAEITLCTPRSQTEFGNEGKNDIEHLSVTLSLCHSVLPVRGCVPAQAGLFLYAGRCRSLPIYRFGLQLGGRE